MKLAAAAAQKFLKSPDPNARAALLYGPNRARVADAVTALCAKLIGPRGDAYSLTRLNEDDVKRDKARLLDDLAAQSLLGGDGPRVVKVRVEGDAAADSVIWALEALDGGAPAAAFLVVEGGDLAARSKIRAAFEKSDKAAALAFYEDEPADLAKFAEATAREAGVTLQATALEAVLASLPNDRGVVRAEIEKLALFGHGLDRPVRLDEALTLCASDVETALDAAGLAALNGEAGAAMEALAHGEAGGVQALKALERRLLRLYEARALIDGGVGASEAIGKLRPPVFFKERDSTLAHLRRWSIARIDAALAALWRAQTRAMTGGAAQDLIAADAYRAVAEIARR